MIAAFGPSYFRILFRVAANGPEKDLAIPE